MKTNKILLFAALAMACACSKNNPVGPDPLPDDGYVSLRADMEASKSALSGLDVIWQENDSIRVFSNKDYNGTTAFLRSGAGTKYGAFDNHVDGKPIKVLEGSTFYVCFPANCYTVDDTGLTLQLPSSITRPDEGGFGPESNPCFCCCDKVSGGASVSMSNLCGLVKISLKGDITITELRMTLDKDIAGNAHFAMPSKGDKPAPKITSNGSRTISQHCDAVKLNGSIGTDFYFVVPADTYNSISLTAVNHLGVPTTLNKPSFNFTVGRSAITTLSSTLPSDGIAGMIENMTVINYTDATSGIVREEMDFVSFNIKTQSDDADLASQQKWSSRKAGIFDFFNDADKNYPIIGTQENEYRQRKEIADNCTSYSVFGYGSEYGKDQSGTGGPIYARENYNADSGNYIFYRAARVTKLDGGIFWLSSTPSKISKFSSSKHYRTCVWIKFKSNLTNKEFYVFNTHLDNSSDAVRGQQLDVLWAQMNVINADALPMVLMGDLNMTTTGSSLEIFKNSGKMIFCRNKLNVCFDDEHKSYNAWGGNGSNIDHIAFSNLYGVKQFQTDISEHAGVTYMSDHYPIIATLAFNPVKVD